MNRAGVSPICAAEVDPRAALGLFVPLISECHVHPAVAVKVGQGDPAGVDGPERGAALRVEAVGRPPVNVRLIEPIDGDVVGQTAARKHEVGMTIAVEVVHRSRHGTDGREPGAPGRSKAVRAAPVNVRVKLRARAIESVGDHQIEMAVAVAVGDRQSLGALGREFQMPLGSKTFLLPVDRERELLVVVVR